ncbi:hypothetical protein PG995_005349 [Apiospora arundinis]
MDAHFEDDTINDKADSGDDAPAKDPSQEAPAARRAVWPLPFHQPPSPYKQLPMQTGPPATTPRSPPGLIHAGLSNSQVLKSAVIEKSLVPIVSVLGRNVPTPLHRAYATKDSVS